MRILLFFGLVLAGTAIAEVISSDDPLLAAIGQRVEKMTRVTEKPHLMKSKAAFLCSASAPARLASPHDYKYCHVYVTNAGAPVMKEGKGTYPEGTMIVKEKFADASAKTTELFTAMVKREKGFNPDGGDWEYFVISGDGKKIEQHGKMESCINCHDGYESTDYVTREYMKSDHP